MISLENITDNDFFLQKNMLLSGLIAAIVYFAIDFLLGVISDPNTSVDQSSQFYGIYITATGSNLIIGYIASGFYFILLIFFALVLFAQFTTIKESNLKFTSFFLIALSIVGILMLIFNADYFSSINSILGVLISFLTLGAMIYGGYYSKDVFETPGFFIVSVVLALLLFFLNGYGFFLVWLGAISYLLYNSREKKKIISK